MNYVHRTNEQIRNKIKTSYFTFPKILITWTHCTIPPPLPSALHSTTPLGLTYYKPQPYIPLPSWASLITTFSLTCILLPIWASGVTKFSLTVTPLSFRYYHRQPYFILPLWASGITTFSLTNHYPLRLQVLPPSALQPVHTTVYPNVYIRLVQYLFNCGTVYYYLFAEWALNILFVAELYRLKWNSLLSVASCLYRHW